MSEPSVELIQDAENQMAVLFANGRRLTQRAARLVHPELHPTGLYLLRMLQKRGPLRPSAIAEYLEMDRSAVSRVLSPLGAWGLVERISDEHDRRAYTVSLTEEGRSRLANLATGPNGPLRAILATWDAEDIATLTRLLTRLNEDAVANASG